jgi:hypothetical protein
MFSVEDLTLSVVVFGIEDLGLCVFVCMKAEGFGFEDMGLGFRVLGLGFKDSGLGLRVYKF